MKIKIGYAARDKGFTEDEAARIGEGMTKRFGGRFDVTEIGILVHDLGGEVQFKITGATPKHGDQQFELNLSLKMLEGRGRQDVLNMIGQCAFEAADRDLAWLESGRCLGMPSTKQLDEAREFFIKHLREIEEEWIAAQVIQQTTEATPVPLHIHLSNVIAGLTPVQVDDAHRERAEELRTDMLAKSPVGDGEMYPIDYALDMMSQAIADAEARGEKRVREQASKETTE